MEDPWDNGSLLTFDRRCIFTLALKDFSQFGKRFGREHAPFIVFGRPRVKANRTGIEVNTCPLNRQYFAFYPQQ